ncbi:hypothetical protein D3C84_1055670 [compost metagenome]
MKLGLLDTEHPARRIDVCTRERKRLGDTQPVDRNEIIGRLGERDQLRSRVDVWDQAPVSRTEEIAWRNLGGGSRCWQNRAKPRRTSMRRTHVSGLGRRVARAQAMASATVR